MAVERLTTDPLRQVAQGFLRVEPPDGDTSIAIEGKHFIATEAPVHTRVTWIDGGWRLSVRHESIA
jgi:hypothetical protein